MSNTTSISSATIDPSNQIKYIIMQICLIPSIICSIFTFTNLLLNHNLRSALHNHTLLALLIISMFDSFFNHPFTLNYLRLSRVIPSTNSMCLFWNFANTLSAILIYWTMAWSSVERHLLIFHSRLFTTRSGRLLFHYIPLFITTIIYPIVTIIIIILLYPCQNQFNMMLPYCGYTCGLKTPSVGLYVRFMHQFIPTLVVAGSALTLIIRVIKQKRQLHQYRFDWRRYRRMIIQLLTLARLFLILTCPAVTVGIVQFYCLPTFGANLQVTYFNFFVRFIPIFMPFICLNSLPEIWPKLLPWNPITPIQAPIIRT